MSPRFAKFVLTKLMGWSWTEGIPPERTCIFLAVPHTSMVDFLIGYLYYRAMGGHLRIMIKKEFFFPPLGWLLRSMGAFPIDRENPGETMKSLVEAMNDPAGGRFHLAMCPEGTRKPVRKWKLGYHTIAEKTGAPVYLAYWDYGTRTVGTGKPFPITSDARGDTDRIQAIYEDMKLTAYHPDKYVTH